MKKVIRKLVEKTGYTVSKTVKKSKDELLKDQLPDVQESEFWEIYKFCKPYTMTSAERMYSLYQSVDYVLKNKIPGALIECGVWRGGSSMLVAQLLSKRGIKDRTIVLYDTFEGMSEPTENDLDLSGNNAGNLLEETKDNKETSVWCLADLNDVKQNMAQTEYPMQQIVFIKGKVEDTIPSQMPFDQIALLRLDTDWYASTKHELEHLFPVLSEKGVLIIDDYGHWEGCRKAVDEFFNENEIPILLNRVDYTGRVGIKTR